MSSKRLKLHQKASTQHYQTFPSPTSANSQDGSADPPQDGEHDHESSLPVKQLIILAIIALCEQTALNSISPYLPEMTSTFPEVGDVGEIGLYVGTIASSFALAQFVTNFFWGWLSDRIGRKPVIMIGTLLTAACFVAFGFCRTMWQAVVVQVLMGLVNGNSAVINTCLGEITDRSNQSKAFVYLPVIYGIGGITGPALGGLLILNNNPFKQGQKNPYPYLLPNLVAALVLIVDLVLTGFFLEESLEEAKDLPPLKERVHNLFSWLWQFTSGGRHPTEHHLVDGTDYASESSASLLSMPDFFATTNSHLTSKEILNRDTVLLLSTYLVFQLSNISFNSLYPVFASSPAPTGRNLSPSEIGLSLSFAGIVTIVFQVGIFGKLKEKMGNKATYRTCLLGFFFSMMMMPWVGYRDSSVPFGLGDATVWLWIEIGFVLLVKTVAAVGGLTSALLLITNSAPSPSVLGTLNGLAQTLSAAGRAAGPFLSGGLFSIATRVRPKGEALAWGVFGGVAFLGFLASWGIRGKDLESEGWSESDEDEEDEDEDEEE